MLIKLQELKVIPAALMVVFTLRSCVNLTAIDQQLISYAVLAATLGGFLFSAYLIFRSNAISKVDVYILFFLAIIAFSSLIHNTDIKEWVYICCTIMFLRFTFFSYQHDIRPLIIGLTIGLDFGVFAQLHQLITHPEMWMIENTKDVSGYIFGNNYNQIGVGVLVAMVLSILCVKINKFFMLLLIPVVIAGISLPIMVSSMTAVTCIILFLIICLIPSKVFRRTITNAVFGAVALFQMFVCFNGKGIENNGVAVWFIEDILKKDITFTYRTHMWDSSIRIITESPIWGYGYPDSDWYRSNMTSFAIGPHNIILATLIYGGIIAFFLYMFFITYSCIKASNARDYWGDCILASIAAISLMMLMEAYPLPIVFILFTLAEYYNCLKHPASSHE